MATQGIICDFRIRRSETGSPHSLLTMPLGIDHMIDTVLSALTNCGCDHVLIVPAFKPCHEYLSRIAELADHTPVTVVDPDERTGILTDGESSDSLVFLDPRYWPAGGFELNPILKMHREYFGPVFGVHLSPEAGDQSERVLMDASGNVRKIQRAFDKTLWSNADATTVPFCVIPHGLIMHGPTFPLSKMRQQLAQHGAPIRDIPMNSRTRDLSRQSDLIAFCSDRAANPTERDLAIAPPGPDQPHALVAREATVADTARLIGHVMVLPDALVGENAIIIGPTVIGQGATIGSDVTVSQSVVLDRTVVPCGVQIHHQIFAGDIDTDNAHDTIEDAPRLAQPVEGEFEVVGSDPGHVASGQKRLQRSLVVKRIMDITVSLTGLIVLTPLMLLTVILIKLTSTGPVFFIHRREGRDGREFGCAKFRTMRTDAHAMQRELAQQNEADGPQFVIKKDPRVTPLGRILRKSNIDELPQLFNVLMGDMSLVGPRPSPFRENQVCLPWRKARLSVPPGITGLWQVCRHSREEGDFHQWIYFDTAYVRHMSAWLDVKIIFYTFVTLGGRRPVAMERIVGQDAEIRQASMAAGT